MSWSRLVDRDALIALLGCKLNCAR